MSEKRIKYRKLRKYKYRILQDYLVEINIKVKAENKFIQLSDEGLLQIKKEYAWDGPSGPTIDTKSFMRASLVHDALYQLMRAGCLDHKKYRKEADSILQNMCIEDGMQPFWAKVAYRGLRWFAAFAAKPQKDIESEILWAPK